MQEVHKDNPITTTPRGYIKRSNPGYRQAPFLQRT